MAKKKTSEVSPSKEEDTKNTPVKPSKSSSRFVSGLSTGSTLLNLACSGEANIGFLGGHYALIVGDSASGKTFLSLTCLAEASINPAFKDYHFIYDNAEDGALMDMERFFGKAVAERTKPPTIDEDKNPIYSSTIEEFFFFVDDALEKNEPFIYILDSMDSLSSEDESSKFEELKKASRNGKTTAGSYGTSKAKANSSGLRRVISKLNKTGSILIIISQTRDNIGFGWEKKTRSGGHALRFYASLEIWSSIKGKIKKKVKGKDRQLGIISQIQVKKNRLTGRERTVEVPIYHSAGIDDIGSCVEYLVEEGYWSVGKTGFINAPEVGENARLEDIVAAIEANNLEANIRNLVAKVWTDIERASEVQRKRRYE